MVEFVKGTRIPKEKAKKVHRWKDQRGKECILIVLKEEKKKVRITDKDLELLLL